MLQCTIMNGADPTARSALLIAALVLSPAPASAETNVFRCTNQAGEVEFRQTACAPEAEEKTLTIQDRNAGWIPPRPEAGRSTDPDDRRRRGTRRTRQGSASSKQDERCWKKRRQLDEVNWQLRSGYKASKGTKLRRRRSEYEDYLDRFCSGR